MSDYEWDKWRFLRPSTLLLSAALSIFLVGRTVEPIIKDFKNPTAQVHHDDSKSEEIEHLIHAVEESNALNEKLEEENDQLRHAQNQPSAPISPAPSSSR